MGWFVVGLLLVSCSGGGASPDDIVGSSTVVGPTEVGSGLAGEAPDEADVAGDGPDSGDDGDGADVVQRCGDGDELDALGALIRSGQPTYDYEPAGTLDRLVERSDVVIRAELIAIERIQTGEFDAWTTFDLADVEVLAGSGVVMRFGTGSWWADGLGPDPLAERIVVDGAEVMAFLTAFDAAPGGWAPHVEGVVVGCSGVLVPAIGLVAPPDTQGLTVPEIAELVDVIATADPVDEARSD